MLANLSHDVRQYLIITTNYWVFTLTDGALRMLVLLHFHSLGYSPLQIAMLFLFYEFFGVVTNLVGGWLGARFGLNNTMNAGLFLQIAALSALLVPPQYLGVGWVMMAQAASGIAKDLNKMSAKSAIKLLVDDGQQGKLYKWVALLTGSKNTLKGAGFFAGALLLSLLGFRGAIVVMVIALSVTWVWSLIALKSDLGKSSGKPKFSAIFSKSSAVNWLSAARLFLFCSRDVWFVVALPVYFSQTLGWDHWRVGGFFALWIVGYGMVQAVAPAITHAGSASRINKLVVWGGVLSVVPLVIALALFKQVSPLLILMPGLLLFGVLFAINSALHSYMIVSYANADGVSLDVGFYYMANAAGRLFGTVLSGWIFQMWGLVACLLMSAIFVLLASLLSIKLPDPTARPV